ncbi:MAG TPA: sterol desaturase family protein [Rhodanobacteraceae bacterium]|nr:sterol desaturase family protein [Rhodanobacteraceae bacterium]
MAIVMDYEARMNESSPNASLQWLARLSGSRFNCYAGLSSDIGVAVALLAAGLWRDELRLSTTLLIVLCGVLIFSLIEYCVHRWLFHGPLSMFEEGHRRHHEQPEGYDALPFFLPPLAYLALAALLSNMMSTGSALLLAGGVASGYAAYGLSHWSMHNFRFRSQLLRTWAAAHHVHHYHPERNFGVTSPLWDLLLRSQYISAAKLAPRRTR